MIPALDVQLIRYLGEGRLFSGFATRKGTYSKRSTDVRTGQSRGVDEVIPLQPSDSECNEQLPTRQLFSFLPLVSSTLPNGTEDSALSIASVEKEQYHSEELRTNRSGYFLSPASWILLECDSARGE